MPAIENNTPFRAQVFGTFDTQAQEILVLVVSATFAAGADGETTVAEEQVDILPTDRHRGDPLTTSITYPGQLAYKKPSTDILVTGHAYAPHGRPVESMTVSLQIADVKKTLIVCGDRFWKTGVVGRVASSPRRFEQLPVIYERAFGGGAMPEGAQAPSRFEPRNPIGVGLTDLKPADPDIDTDLPNVEYPSDRMETMKSRPRPAGFGALAPNWQPRAGFGGTYDGDWLARQAPLLPSDFDPRFFQLAPTDQQSRTVRAGDRVEITGMTPEGLWEFRLPPLEVPLALVYRDRIDSPRLLTDTIHLEPDRKVVHVLGRVVIPVHRNRPPLAQIILGAIRPGWKRAHYSGKIYRRTIGSVR